MQPGGVLGLVHVDVAVGEQRGDVRLDHAVRRIEAGERDAARDSRASSCVGGREGEPPSQPVLPTWTRNLSSAVSMRMNL